MSSRALSSALSPFHQAAIARALPGRGVPGVLFNTIVGIEGRRFAVTAARPLAEGDWERAFSAVVARRAAGRVDRLLPVVATGCHDGYHWVAYETGRARPLAADGWRRWPAKLAIDLVSDVCNTLDDAAAFGIVPYELLPSSIFMDARLGPLLGDLGAAREVVGSPPADDDPGRPFTPPEVVAGGVAGARSSVYVCGALLYALLAGGPPRQDPIKRWRADLPEEINLVLSRAMAADTLERYRSAAEFCESARPALHLAPVSDADTDTPITAPADPEPIVEREAFVPLAAEPFEPAEAATREAEVSPPGPAEEAPSPADERRLDRAFAPADDPAFRPLPDPAFQPAGDAAFQPVHEVRDDYEWAPLSPAVRRLRIALAAVFVVAAAVAGFQLAQPDPPARASGAEVSGAGLHITLPAGWYLGEARGRELLAAYPSSDWFAGLTIRAGGKGAAGETGSDPVRLGSLDMWRDAGDAPRVVRYLLPTSDGSLQISCEAASPQTAQATLAACERSLSTLSLDEAKPVPLQGVARKPGLRAALEQLRRDRMAGRAALARARTPKAQRAAALRLERAHSRAARRLEKLPETDALAASAERTARAYGTLAGLAGSGNRTGWQTALAGVRRADATLAGELAGQG